MINLIPNQEKKVMIRGFYYRLAVLSLWMLSISVFIAILALLPAYLFSVSKNSIAAEKLQIQQGQVAPSLNKENSTIIKDINNKLNIIETSQKKQFLVSDKIINEIILKKASNIKITGISYEDNSQSGKKVNISGTAPSREVLLLFRKSLEEDTKSFKGVDLPISNFVKGSNIQFSLSLSPVQ